MCYTLCLAGRDHGMTVVLLSSLVLWQHSIMTGHDWPYIFYAISFQIELTYYTYGIIILQLIFCEELLDHNMAAYIYSY